VYPDKNNPASRPEPADLRLQTDVCSACVRSLAELAPVFERLEAWMRVLGYGRRDLFAVWLALHEAVSNAVRHGNRGDPAKRVRVTYLVRPGEVAVEVEDQGRGFDPSLVPDPLTEENVGRPGGRGLFLMRAYMNLVCFNRAGNRVTLCRLRTGS
jgi:serine/threonine-protein kinase RsbW